MFVMDVATIWYSASNGDIYVLTVHGPYEIKILKKNNNKCFGEAVISPFSALLHQRLF